MDQTTILIFLSLFVNSVNSQFPEFGESLRNARIYDAENQIVDETRSFADHLAADIIDTLTWLKLENLQAETTAQSNLSTECSVDFTKYTDSLLGGNITLWALRMADSTGKLESGLLDGNMLFEGRYLLCQAATKDIPESELEVEPLFCLANWVTGLPDQGVFFLRGLGMCIPHTCTDDDAAILLRTVYNPPLLPNFRDITIKCDREEQLDAEAIISIIILSLFGLLVVVASLYDAYKAHKETSIIINENITITSNESPPTKVVCHVNGAFNPHETTTTNSENQNNSNNSYDVKSAEDNEMPSATENIPKQKEQSAETKHKGISKENSTTEYSKPGLIEQVLLSFSLYQNVPLVVGSSQPRGAIGCINGLRFIAMSCVILGHTYSMSMVSLENLMSLYSVVNDTINAKLASMDVYVDTFFILSALLVSMSFLKQLKRNNGKLGIGAIALHYFNRYWRLTPTYFIVLMVYTNLIHYFIVGPYFPEYYADADICATEWWKNLLYINNLFTDGQLCMAWSWYLAIDMQLFVIAPIFLYLLYRWEKVGIVAIVLGFCGGLIANIVLHEKFYTQTDDTEDPIDDWNDIYIKPWTRCPVYFMGMLLGYVFYKTDGKIKMPKVVVIIGWIVAASLYLICAYLPSLDGCYHSIVLYDCHWSVAGQVVWSTLFRPMWGIWVCWCILACHTGYGGIVNTVLSWNFFVPLGRLTYLGYLIHIILIAVFIYSSPLQLYFTHYYMVYMFFANLLVTNLLSLVLCVVISAPLMKLAAVFLPSRGKKDIR